jgi:protein-S-isoprenylcysteine O-methyltransferase Ste14
MSTIAPATAASPAPRWAARLQRLNQHLMFELGGGPSSLKAAWVINLQKAGCFPFFALLMWLYADRTPWATSPAAWTYLALHGSYGLVWLLKDMVFPDPNWQHRCTWGSAVYLAAGLALYWAIGWVLISGVSDPRYPLPDNAWLALCIALCILGSVLMFGSDTQKFVQLRAKRGLITSGLFTYIRHPNYLGEMMIYGSFALLAWHWLPVLVLGYVWLGLFAPNMAMKEASMSRYPEWAEYRRRTWWLVPGLL